MLPLRVTIDASVAVTVSAPRRPTPSSMRLSPDTLDGLRTLAAAEGSATMPSRQAGRAFPDVGGWFVGIRTGGRLKAVHMRDVRNRAVRPTLRRAQRCGGPCRPEGARTLRARLLPSPRRRWAATTPGPRLSRCGEEQPSVRGGRAGGAPPPARRGRRARRVDPWRLWSTPRLRALAALVRAMARPPTWHTEERAAATQASHGLSSAGEEGDR